MFAVVHREVINVASQFEKSGGVRLYLNLQNGEAGTSEYGGGSYLDVWYPI